MNQYPCGKPPVREHELEQDKFLFGVAYKEHCQECGHYHRIAPDRVVIESVKPMQARVLGEVPR